MGTFVKWLAVALAVCIGLGLLAKQLYPEGGAPADTAAPGPGETAPVAAGDVATGIVGGWLVAWVAIGGGIGYLLASGRGRGTAGFFLGFILGPLGWIFAAVLPANTPRR